jgi:hypothetical protein
MSATPHHPDCQIIPIAPVADAKFKLDPGLVGMVKCHPDCPRRKVKA